MNFKKAVSIILIHEGGYNNYSFDPGGETKYGISKRSYPNLDIKNLTEEEAIQIYYTDYWEPACCSLLPREIRLIMFDCAVNQGLSKAIKILQSCLGVIADGLIGPKTLSAANSANPYHLLRKFALKRHSEYAKLPSFVHFGSGWTKRLLDISILSMDAD